LFFLNFYLQKGSCGIDSIAVMSEKAAIATQVKSQEAIDSKTDKATTGVMDSPTIFTFAQHKYLPKSGFSTFVADFITVKDLRTKSFQPTKNLSVIHKGNWKESLGPLFGQLLPNLNAV
jgi:hypothetical protein